MQKMVQLYVVISLTIDLCVVLGWEKFVQYRLKHRICFHEANILNFTLPQNQCQFKITMITERSINVITLSRIYFSRSLACGDLVPL